MRIGSYVVGATIAPLSRGRAVLGGTNVDSKQSVAIKLFSDKEDFDAEAAALRQVQPHASIIRLLEVLPPFDMVAPRSSEGGDDDDDDDERGSERKCDSSGAARLQFPTTAGALVVPYYDTVEDATAWVAASPARIRSCLRQLLAVRNCSTPPPHPHPHPHSPCLLCPRRPSFTGSAACPLNQAGAL